MPDTEERLELARWQGSVEAHMKSLTERTSDLESAVRGIETSLTKVQVQLAALKTQVGVWSALGGVLGAAIATAVGVIVGGHA